MAALRDHHQRPDRQRCRRTCPARPLNHLHVRSRGCGQPLYTAQTKFDSGCGELPERSCCWLCVSPPPPNPPPPTPPAPAHTSPLPLLQGGRHSTTSSLGRWTRTRMCRLASAAWRLSAPAARATWGTCSRARASRRPPTSGTASTRCRSSLCRATTPEGLAAFGFRGPAGGRAGGLGGAGGVFAVPSFPATPRMPLVESNQCCACLLHVIKTAGLSVPPSHGD